MMRSHLFSLVLMTLATTAYAQPAQEIQIRLNADVGEGVQLEPGNDGNLNAFNPGWAPEAKRDRILSVVGKDLSENFNSYRFSFTPKASGEVRLVLSAAQPRKNTASNLVGYTIYDNITVKGATLQNGDFEQLDQHDDWIGWEMLGPAIKFRAADGIAAQVSTRNELTQMFNVEADRKVTFTFEARGLVDEALQPQTKTEGGQGRTPGKSHANQQKRGGINAVALTGDGVSRDVVGVYPPNWYMLDLDTPLPDAKPRPQATDITDELTRRIAEGEQQIQLDNGRYCLTRPVRVPADVTIIGSANTVLELAAVTDPLEPVIALDGDNITLENLQLELSDALLKAHLEVKNRSLIYGENLKNIKFTRLDFRLTDRQYILARRSRQRPLTNRRNMPVRWTVVTLDQCTDVEMTNSVFENFAIGLETVHCTRVSFRDNRGINGIHNMLRFYHGSEYLKFHNNWFSHVKHPMVWDGGDASYNDALDPNEPDRVDRSMEPGDSDYAGHMTGTYEILCTNNYGEYGKTLIWGRKGRRIVIMGNSSRFTYDLAYDAEGCGEVIFANNLAMNSKAGGVGAFYHNDSTVITGNLFSVHDVGDDIYKGEFLRVHANKNLQSSNTLIANNLFVNHLDEPRFLRIDAADAITIEGNKFVNGGIFTNPYGGGRITVTGNSFVSDLTGPGALVRIQRSASEFTFRNNTMVNRASAPHADSAAIEIVFNRRGGPPGNDEPTTFRQIEGNSFRGWPTPIAYTGLNADNRDAQILLIRNTTDGKLDVPASLPNVTEAGNIQINPPR